MIQRMLAVMVLALLWAMPAVARPLPQADVTVNSMQIRPAASGAEEVHFLTTGIVTPSKVFTLNNPDRAVIDLPLVAAKDVSMPPDYHGTLVRAVRFGRFEKTTSRIVLDLAGPCAISSTASQSELVVTLLPVSVTGTASAAPPVVAMHRDGTPASPVVEEAKKPLIVIDAGHGGEDPGALGVRKVREKDVTLGYASALQDALLRTGRYRVAMTRVDDRFIMLADRVSIARRQHADIFISLHADSNPNKDAQGLSIYSLSATASDAESAALAERENKADIVPGINLNGADEDVANILIDLTQRETMNKSAQIADEVVSSMHPKIPLLEKTHRFAGFRVLKAPDFPSVLVELGFLSNIEDQQRLYSPEYQQLVVTSIIKGLDTYRAQEKL